MNEKSYEKSNREMRSKYKKETGKTLGKRLTSGTSKRRVSFACRFAGMAGAMKDNKGNWIKENLNFDQLIWEFGTDTNPNWIHVSYVSEDENRNRCLKAYKEKGRTKYKVI